MAGLSQASLLQGCPRHALIAYTMCSLANSAHNQLVNKLTKVLGL